MIKIERISTLQIIFMLFACRMTIGFIYLPLLTSPGNQDLWISVVGSSIICMFFSVPLIFLAYKFPEENLLQYCQRIMGKIIGRILGMIFMGFFLVILIAIMADLVNFIHTAILPETPAYAILITMLIPCIYTTFRGLETIGRVSEFLIPYFFVVIILFTVLNLPRMDFNVFLPILSDSNIQDLATGSYGVAARYYDLLILAMLVPNLNNKQDIKKIVSYYIILSTVFLLIFTVSTQSVLGIEFSKHVSFPYYKYVRTIEVFDFIERIESLVVIAWVIIQYIKFSLYLYCTTIGLGQIFNIKKSNKMIIPICLLLLFVVEFFKIIKSLTVNKIILLIPYFGSVAYFGLPLIIVIIYFFRRKTLNKSN